MKGGVTPRAMSGYNDGVVDGRPLMPPTSLCIVARSMTGFSERERIARSFSVVLVSCGIALVAVACSLGGCDFREQLDGRNRNRKGNRLFRDTQFVDAVAEYQKALTEVDDPKIHYNLGQAYSKVVKAGYDGPILLGLPGDFVCRQVPGVKLVQAGACVKEGDRHFAECGSAKTSPIEKAIAELNGKLKDETDDDKKKDLKTQIGDKQQELSRFQCSSTARCVEGQFCSLTSPELAELAAQHFLIWIKAQPSDEDIKKLLAAASRDLQEAKDQTRKQMTLLWTDTEQFKQALDYWEGLLREKPNDPEIMGNLAGINLKAGNWRKAIEWYNKVAEVTNDASSKVATYQYIGNLAWSKLNSRTLIGAEAIELADRGIGALQRAAEIDPKNPRPVGTAASLFNFRSTAHGASFAAAIDRTSQKDLSEHTRVLLDEAKKAQGQPTGSPTTPAAGSTSSAPSGSGSAGAPASGGSGSSAQPAAGSATARTGSGAGAPPTPPAPATAPGGAAKAPTSGSGAAAAPPRPATPAAPPPEKPATQAPAPAPEKPPAEPTPPAAPSSGGSAEKSGG
ncbi:MAG: tetratricopeptide repeat protein [Deltaproteobacteria bacterium]|nr:MAG: tetratricopeptide repeat protein [Deltaproteobacteria bacterium]